MPGLSDYSAEAILNHVTGAIPLTTNYSRFLALYTTAPTGNSGSGATEVSGGSYARVQFAGRLQAGASWTTSSTTITLSATAPSWLTALGSNGSGVNVYDTTTGQQIGTVSSISGTTVTLTGAAANASSGSSDFLQFSAFLQAAASSGTEPAVTPSAATSGSAIAYAQSSAAWGTVTSFGVYDASTGGNFYGYDFLNQSGSGKWSPCTISSASPGVITCTDQSFTNGGNVEFTNKYGGSLPSLSSGSWTGLQTVAGDSGNTFNVGLNTTSAGDGYVRGVTTLAVGGTPTVVQFISGSLILQAA